MLWFMAWGILAGCLCAVGAPAVAAMVGAAIVVAAAWGAVRLERRQRADHEKRLASQPDGLSEEEEMPAFQRAVIDQNYREPEPDRRPLLPRFVHDETAKMDGSRIIIDYCDANERTTQRVIRCGGLNLEQDGLDVTPFAIEAFCELRGAKRTFIICRIGTAWHLDGQEITDLEKFLISHTTIPREGDAYKPEPFHEEEIDGTEIKIFYTLPQNPRGRSVVLSVLTASYLPVLADGEVVGKLDSISGHNAKNGAFRKVMLDRITSVCDPETGEVIDDLAAWVEAHQV